MLSVMHRRINSFEKYILTEYYREEFAKFTAFLTSKRAEFASFRVKLVNFPSEKGRFGCLLRS